MIALLQWLCLTKNEVAIQSILFEFELHFHNYRLNRHVMVCGDHVYSCMALSKKLTTHRVGTITLKV